MSEREALARELADKLESTRFFESGWGNDLRALFVEDILSAFDRLLAEQEQDWRTWAAFVLTDNTPEQQALDTKGLRALICERWDASLTEAQQRIAQLEAQLVIEAEARAQLEELLRELGESWLKALQGHEQWHNRVYNDFKFSEHETLFRRVRAALDQSTPTASWATREQAIRQEERERIVEAVRDLCEQFGGPRIWGGGSLLDALAHMITALPLLPVPLPPEEPMR